MTAVRPEELLESLEIVGSMIRATRNRLAELVETRQDLVREARNLGIPLATAAKAAGVAPEAIRNIERRRQQAS